MLKITVCLGAFFLVLRFFTARQIKISQFNALENGTFATAAGGTVDINRCTMFALFFFF